MTTGNRTVRMKKSAIRVASTLTRLHFRSDFCFNGVEALHAL
jgi:hypothetical protein